MSRDTIFRRKIEPVERASQVTESPVTENVVEERIDGAAKDVDAIEEVDKASPLEEWETKNGKYGIEYLGISGIEKEFPINVHFSSIDKYIKGEIAERNLPQHPKSYQSILDSLEEEIGSKKLKTFERLKKIHDYIQVVKKWKALNEKKNSYRAFL